MHRITATHTTKLVPQGESLVLEHDDRHEITVLGAVLQGPDTLYSYVTVKHEDA